MCGISCVIAVWKMSQTTTKWYLGLYILYGGKSFMKKFQLGREYITPGIEEKLFSHEIKGLMELHQSGNWGDLEEEDKKQNEAGLSEEKPGRLMSTYKVRGIKVWVITEWDRSVTTVLLPEEY